MENKDRVTALSKSQNTVGRERENQQDATIRCSLLTSVSTCFGHHYAHLQENKDRVTALSKSQNTVGRERDKTNKMQQLDVNY